jgi:hypothetical protein
MDTSRMSWADCHIGYMLFWAICLLISPIFNIAFVVALIAGLNGGYAIVFSQRPPGLFSRPIWWLALFTSVLFLTFFAAFEIGNFLEGGGIETGDLLVIAIITKLTIGQLLFLFRIRRERPTYACT